VTDRQVPMRWLIGYQKSGTTWLLVTLVNLLNGPIGDWAGHRDLIPNWDDVFCAARAPLGWCRGHVACSNRVPHLERALGALVIVRHPLDVLVSSFRYRMLYDWDVPEAEIDYGRIGPYVDVFIANRGDPTFNKTNKIDWYEHVRTWTAYDPGFSVAWVRYEDLREGAEKVLTPALNRIGVTVDRAAVASALQAASLVRMRRLDDQSFIGAARVGQWRELLTTSQVRAAMDAFGPLCELLRYEM
jgi:hypothetical protein